jgi:hypothetical protein
MITNVFVYIIHTETVYCPICMIQGNFRHCVVNQILLTVKSFLHQTQQLKKLFY